MLRMSLLASVFFATAVATAADLPKDIATEARVEVIKKWHSTYQKVRADWTTKLDEAKSLIKDPATEKQGKKQLADATAALKNIEARPWALAEGPFKFAQETRAGQGDVVALEYARGVYEVVEQRAEGVVVETTSGLPEKRTTYRYLIASPITVPKAIGKKPAEIKVPGLWYWAGSIEVNGKSIPVLYTFELKKDDYPSDKK